MQSDKTFKLSGLGTSAVIASVAGIIFSAYLIINIAGSGIMGALPVVSYSFMLFAFICSLIYILLIAAAIFMILAKYRDKAARGSK